MIGVPGKARQRSLARQARCNRAHSAVTQKVIVIEVGKVNIHAAFLMFASGQLRFLGLLQYFKQAVQAAFVDGHHGLLTHFGFGVVGH